MSETKKLHKIFWIWEYEKEERWLNQMAQEGWALQNAGFSTYTFERCEPGEYIIRMAMLNDSANFKEFMEEMDAEKVGACMRWVYFRRKADLGAFAMFSDIDSRVAQLDRIGKQLSLICLANIVIGLTSISSGHSLAFVNLLCAALLAYGLGRIHGKKESLALERQLHE